MFFTNYHRSSFYLELSQFFSSCLLDIVFYYLWSFLLAYPDWNRYPDSKAPSGWSCARQVSHRRWHSASAGDRTPGRDTRAAWTALDWTPNVQSRPVESYPQSRADDAAPNDPMRGSSRCCHPERSWGRDAPPTLCVPACRGTGEKKAANKEKKSINVEYANHYWWFNNSPRHSGPNGNPNWKPNWKSKLKPADLANCRLHWSQHLTCWHLFLSLYVSLFPLLLLCLFLAPYHAKDRKLFIYLSSYLWSTWSPT